MVFCRNHPDRPVRVTCQKNDTRGYCEECLENGAPCFDPKLYCKFRSQCIIWEMARENGSDHQAREAFG